MKRWPIILLITLAVIVFLSPGIIGHLAEKNLDENMSWLEEENADIVITSEQFDRGWFTSEGRHRVTVKGGTLFDMLDVEENAGADNTPSLIIDTRLDHGLVPITSMGREEGSLVPGLANTVSTLTVDNGNGKLVDLPGKVFSTIGLTGNSTLHYVMEAGSQTDENTLMTWSGADITVNTDPANRSFSAKGNILPTSIESDGVNTEIGPVTFDIVQDRSRYAFGIGSLQLDIDSLTVISPREPKSGFGKVHVDLESELDGDRVNGRSSIEFGHVIMPGLGDMNMFIDIAAKGLDADSLEVIVAALRAVQGTAQTNVAMNSVFPEVESDLETLVTKGVELDITRFDVSLPQGDLSTKININIPESGSNDSFSWPGVLLKTTASVDLTVSAQLYEMIQAMNPQAGSLVAMGVLKRNGDDYEAEVRYASGLLTINGAPMPIPLGMPQ